jgi:hypothetical protein
MMMKCCLCLLFFALTTFSQLAFSHPFHGEAGMAGHADVTGLIEGICLLLLISALVSMFNISRRRSMRFRQVNKELKSVKEER